MSQVSEKESGLSNDRCPTGYEISLLCLFWYVFCVYGYAHTRTLTIVAREYIYIRRGLRVVGSKFQGNARASIRGTTTVGIHVFLFVYMSNMLSKK